MTAAQVQPGPIPVQTIVGVIDPGAGDMVILEAHRPSGVDVFFFSPEHARDLAAELIAQAARAQTGLIIAGPAQLPPPADPRNGHR